MASDCAAAVAGGGLVMALDVALKATGLLVVAYLVHAGLGRRRALARAWLWNATLVGLALIPVATLVSPRLSLPVLVARPAPPAEAPGPVGPAGGSPIAGPVAVSAASASPDLAESVALPAASALAPTPDPTPSRAVLATPPPRRWDWGRVALRAYLAGVGLLLARLVAALGAVARLRRGARRLDDPAWCAALDRWRPQLGIARAVALARSDRVAVPVVVGWLRPTILIPEGLVDPASTGLVAAVLVHELAHVRRGDYGWNLLRKLVGAFYWPHPLTWPLGRIIGAAREQACDDLCVHALGGPSAYRASLLAVAATLAHARCPEVALGLAMARTSHLARRLAWIDRTLGASTCLPRRPARVATLLLVAALAALIGVIDLAHAQAPAPKDEPQPINPQLKPSSSPPDAIEVEVRAHDTGQPLAGAKVKFRPGGKWRDEQMAEAGKVRFDLTKRQPGTWFGFDVWADGYVQQRYDFADDGKRFPKIPPRITVELWPGEETLGGTVVDAAGRPIAGVNVRIWGYLGVKKDTHELATWVGAVTDEAGQWRCRSLRSMRFAYLYLTHPSYLSDTDRQPRPHGQPQPTGPSEADEKAMAALRNFSDVQVMSAGVALAGRVVDAEDRPVAGAEVGWIEAKDQFVQHDYLTLTTTDAAGAFRFAHAPPAALMLQVKAGGHAPELKAVDATRPVDPVVVQLEAPHRITGRVVDPAGKPITNATVFMDAWRGFRTLGVEIRTDAEGRFHWDDAPADPVEVEVVAAGYKEFTSRQGFRSNRVVPDGGEFTLTLRRTLALSGTIRDAATRKAVDDARVDVGVADPAAGAVSWAPRGEIFALQGRLQADLDAETPTEYRLRFQAKGYEPYQTRPIRSDEGQVELDVLMAPEADPTRSQVVGTVLDPAGRPLAGAELGLSYASASDGPERLPTLEIEDGRIKPGLGQAIVRTDAQGRFAVPREPESAWKSYSVIVAHPDGFAKRGNLAFAANPTIETTPWGRIEGVARIGGRAAAGMGVGYFLSRVSALGNGYLGDRGRVQADVDGRFVVERVLPGEVRVSRDYGDNGNPPTWSGGTLLKVAAGQTTQVDIGGRGRPVVARVAVPEGFDPAANYLIYSTFDLQSDRPRFPYPKGLPQQGIGPLQEWMNRWTDSPEGSAYQRDWYELTRARLQPDGTIRVDDVPPGEYVLKLTFTAEPDRGRNTAPDRMAFATRQFVVPPIDGGRTDVPLDLGTLRPRPKDVFRAGQPAPGFDAEGLDGKRVRLQDYRGRFVLLDFWATWCGPCVAEVPELKAVHERFGKDERFAMVSLSLDAAREAPRKFVADRGIGWRQGWLGEWTDGGVPDRYHVEGIPAVFLIGPDGEIRASGLRGDDLMPAVEQVLRGG